MPYALFANDLQLSRAFDSEEEVWEHAKEAGLVDNYAGIDHLENDFTIERCPPDAVATARAKAAV